MRAKVQMIAAMLLFGSLGVFVRHISLTSGQLALVRAVVGSAVLLAVSFLSGRRPRMSAVRRNWKVLLCSGAAIGFNWILLFESYRYTTIAAATLSYYCAPVLVMLLAPAVLRERLRLSAVVCTLAAVAGMALVAGAGPSAAGQPRAALGLGFGLGAAALYACVMLLGRFVHGLTGLESTLIQLAVAAVVLFPYVLATDGLDIASAGTGSLLLALLVAEVHTGVGYWLYFSALPALSWQTAATFCYIDPVSAIFFSALFLGEQPGLWQLAGAALILGAAFGGEWWRDRRQNSAPTPAADSAKNR